MTDFDALVQHADDVDESLRALCHGTFRTLPAPAVYALLGNLNNASYKLSQMLGQMADGLTELLTEYDVYDRNRDPAESVAVANKAMRDAAQHAHQVGDLLSAAQTAINLQGYNTPAGNAGNGDEEAHR